MENNLSILDIRFIQLQLTRLCDEEIATMLNKPVELIHQKIKELTGDGLLKQSWSQRIHQKRILLEEKNKQRKLNLQKKQQQKKFKNISAKQEKPVKICKQNEAAKLAKKKVEESKILKTRIIDRSKLVLVRLDGKTWVEVSPDADIETLKRNYLQKKQESLYQRSQSEKSTKVLSKFK